MRPLSARPVKVREARPSRAAASSDAEKIAGRIVEYGIAVEALLSRPAAPPGVPSIG
jgi:hypothetical protein